MKCPNCYGTSFLEDHRKGETLCKECGVVVEDNHIDTTAEWTNSEDEPNKARAGAPMTMARADMGIRTVIGSKSDFMKLSGSSLRKYKKLQREDVRSATKTERNLKYAFDDLKRFGSVLKLPANVEEEAARLYRRALEKNLIRGRTVEAIMAGCIFLACKNFSVPKGFKEMCELTNVDQKDFGKAFKHVARRLGIRFGPTSAIDFIPRYSAAIGLQANSQSKAVDVLKKAEKAGLDNGKGPLGMAAAALYLGAQLAGQHITQKQVADATAVTEVTIRNRYKEIADTLKLKVAV